MALDNKKSLKIILVGDSGVGKTNILSRYTQDHFEENSKCTIGVEFKRKEIIIEDTSIITQIWDTAGEERFRSVTTAYYKGSKVIIFVFDLTYKDSLKNIEERWFVEASQHCAENSIKVLAGNKYDLIDESSITQEEIEAACKRIGIRYYAVSAKTGLGIQQVFDDVIKDAYERILKMEVDPAQNQHMDLIPTQDITDEKKTKGSCC